MQLTQLKPLDQVIIDLSSVSEKTKRATLLQEAVAQTEPGDVTFEQLESLYPKLDMNDSAERRYFRDFFVRTINDKQMFKHGYVLGTLIDFVQSCPQKNVVIYILRSWSSSICELLMSRAYKKRKKTFGPEPEIDGFFQEEKCFFLRHVK